MAQGTLNQALKKAGYGGWDFDDPVQGEAKVVPPSYPGGEATTIPSDVWTVNVTDPTGQHNAVVKLRKGTVPVEPGASGPPGPGWIVAEAPDLPKPTAAATSNNTEKFEDKFGGVWNRTRAADGTWGPWEVGVAGSQTQFGASEAEAASVQAKWNEIAANAAAGKGNVTNEQAARLKLDQDTGQLSRDTLDQRRSEFEQKNAIDKKSEQRLLDESKANIGLIQARTSGTGVETQINQQRLEQLIASAPDEATARRLANELAQLQMDEIKRKGQRPDIVSLGTESTYGTMGPQGQIQENVRQGYVPKTMAEIAARTGQLDALARQKEAEVTGKVGAGYTNEQALADFNTWYGQNIQPQIGALDAATQEAQYARGKEVAATRQLSLKAAQDARAQAVTEYNASSGEALDPEFGKLLQGVQAGKVPTDVDYSKMWAGSGLRGRADMAAAEALKYVDPQAAAMTGVQAVPYQQMNPQDALNRTRYMAGGGPPPAGPAGPPPAAAAAVAAAPVQDLGQPRADQISGNTPMGNAMAPVAGATGTVNPGDENYLGGLSPAALQAQADQEAQQAQVSADLAALRNQMAQNDVYQYGGGQPAPVPVRRRRPAPAPATVVNLDPFAQQALAAGLGQGGLAPSRWVPPTYEYPNGPVPY